MRVIRQARQMARTAQALRRDRRTIGFVPTMGALHDGHLSLIRQAARDTNVVVVSLFVNPLQFGPQEDYERYPRDLKRDLNLSKAGGTDIVFAPDVSQIYPPGFSAFVDIGELGGRLEGAIRPGHFRGVATVVTKLFHLVQPSAAYVGQKDYQQSVIIQRLVRDLDLPVEIRVMPTVREPDGLAMSSRNASLDADERRQAAVISSALRAAKEQIRGGERDARRIVDAARRQIESQPLARVEYLEVAHAKTLEPVLELRGRVVMLAAVRVGRTRLIDNVLVDVP